MSYCRWSSDDFQCDVYCYEDCMGGYTTHVASSRHVLDSALPPPVPFEKEHIEAWVERHNAVLAWVKNAEIKQIGLPYDGESFNDIDAASTADRLQMLKDIGYNVPQYAIDALREEAGDEVETDRDIL